MAYQAPPARAQVPFDGTTTTKDTYVQHAIEPRCRSTAALAYPPSDDQPLSDRRACQGACQQLTFWHGNQKAFLNFSIRKDIQQESWEHGTNVDVDSPSECTLGSQHPQKHSGLCENLINYGKVTSKTLRCCRDGTICSADRISSSP